MPFKIQKILLCAAGLILLSAFNAVAQRQMEKLGRGVIAVRTNSTSVYVGWRLLANDPGDIAFNVYRITGGVTNQLNGAPITTTCNFVDTTANLNVANSWFVRPLLGGVPQSPSAAFTLAGGVPVRQYLSIPLSPPPGGTSADGVNYSYDANDASAADLDGDGEYEIVLKWEPTNAKDNSQAGFTGNTFIDAYRLDGTFLWRIDLGPNIRSGAHYLPFIVYDLDGDGRAELACRTAPGSRDALGNYVYPDTDNTIVYTNSSGFILSGPEYLTIFEGLTGTPLATTDYLPDRVSGSQWGDGNGNRVDRFLAGVAYLDGRRPSLIMARGYYGPQSAAGQARNEITAWDWRNGQFTLRWWFKAGYNINNNTNVNYIGQGNHNLSIGDVDGDGRDEIIYGACSIDDDGTGIYSTGLGHGDALHVSDMDPDRPGLEVWDIHEPSGVPGADFRDARTGQIIFSTAITTGPEGPGRGVAADVTGSNRGYEMWGAGGLLNREGVNIGRTPGSVNFLAWWDADPIREIMDGNHIDKYGPSSDTRLLTATGASSNNGTKSTPCLSADLFGDWREEVIWRASDDSELRVYTTIIVATNRLYTLMHDPQYRVAIAWQNTAYNQPPHPGFFLGQNSYPQPVAPMSDANVVWKGGGANTWDLAFTATWFTNRAWMSNYTASVFHDGDSVLFDIGGSNHAPVNVIGTLSPGKVTVHAPQDYVFSGGSLAGAMSLVKAGAGKLTLNNSNTFTGPTALTEGTLIVNGTLSQSPVTAQGSVWGTRLGGSGILGQGATLLPGTTLMPGPSNGVPGILTVSNGLTQAGLVRSHFDLSNDPTGATKTNDRVTVVGNLTLSGTNVIEVNQLDGFLGGGVYPLITCSGTLSGGLANLVLAGSFVQPVALTNPPGMIGLVAVIPPAPPSAPTGLAAAPNGAFQINLIWNDNSADENEFLIERSTGNTNNFTQIAAVPANDNNYSDLGLEPTTTYFYRVRGTNLAGAGPFSNIASATTAALPPLLTWRGGGANTWDLATTANWWTGSGFSIFDNGVDVLFDQSGSNNTAINLLGTLEPDSVTVNATKNYTFSGTGSLAGSMALVKSGSGGLTINTAHTFNGGVTLNSGTLTLANPSGAGSGPLTLNGGTLTLSASGGPATYGNAIRVSNTVTLTVSSGNNNQALSGSWTGSNTMNVSVGSGGTFSVQGNMNAFNGTVALGSSAGTFRFFGSTGSSLATFNLGTGTASMVNRDGSTTIRLGALTGGSGTFLRGRSSGSGGSGSNYEIGGNNLNTTFNGRIVNGNDVTRITKVGAATLTLTASNSFTGPTTVNQGTLLVNGNHANASGAVTVGPDGTLGGVGTIGGDTLVSGVLAPGSGGIGRLVLTNLTFTPSGTALFELTRLPLSNDVAQVSGTVTYDGTLTVVNLGVELLQAGDDFRLFDAPVYNGSFSTLIAPALYDDLVWSTARLAVDGRLWVVKSSPPAISSAGIAGNNLIVSGTGGTPNWYYHVLSTTNLSLPLAQWARVATNQFTAAGNFSFTNAVNPNLPQEFFVIELQ